MALLRFHELDECDHGKGMDMSNGSDKKSLPTPDEVAANIYIYAHNNPTKTLLVTDNDLRRGAVDDTINEDDEKRKRLHVGFKHAVFDRLTNLGCQVTIVGGVAKVRTGEEDVISLSEAAKLSKEAQQSGWRDVGGGHDNNIIDSE